jgi:tetratricopeptide (TPR) repeat protein/transcriptional regulator with XRE-family HTH domain
MTKSPATDLQPTCGQLLRRYRALARLTQEELAERCGYSANYIGKLERDERKPPAAALDVLARALELGPQDRAALDGARVRQGARDLPPHHLVGRDKEIAEIRGRVAGIGPPVMLFAGEPGIGKTRLLDEAATRAAQSAWRVVRGGCQRRAADLYAPLSGAVADALQSLPVGDREDVIRQAGQLDLLLPELALAGPQPPSGERTPGWSDASIASDQRRRLLYAAVDRCLRAVAGEAGVLLVLDDLQWAGPDAFDLLRAVVPAAGSTPVQLIGAYRDSERATDAHLQEFVADLARDSQVQVLRLGPLPDADAERLVTDRFSAEDERRAVIPAIVRRAGGVPFFLVSYLDNLPSNEAGEADLSLPWTIAQVIRQRVLALPDTTQELLGVAAAVGRTVSHSVLIQVTRRDDDEVLPALEAAVDARLLTEDTPSGYRFAHDLIRETIEDGLSAGRRRLLHRRIGEALEGDPRASAEALAYHFDLGDQSEKAITYFELAGDQAQQRIANTAAAMLFQRAIDRLQLLARPQDALPIYEKLGIALYRAARNEEAIAALERARAGYQATGNIDGVARMTVRLADAHYRKGGSADDLAQLLNLADRESEQVAEAASEGNLVPAEALARLLHANRSPERLLTVGRTLTRLGRETGSPRLESIGKRAEGAGLIQFGRVAEGTALLETVIPYDPVAENDERAMELASLLSGAYLAMGNSDRSQELSERMLAAAESTGDEVIATVHAVILAGVEYLQGDWPRGRDLLRSVLERSRAIGPSALMVRTSIVVARALIWDGQLEDGRSYLEASLETSRAMQAEASERAVLTELADLDLTEGRPGLAIDRLLPLVKEEQSWEYVVSLYSTLAAAYLELDDLKSARLHADQAVAEARRTAIWLNGVRALEVWGRVEARAGHFSTARAAFDEGLQRARDMPFPYGEARLLRAHAALDQQEGDIASAAKNRSAALAIFGRLGATRDAESIRPRRP